MLGGYQKDVRCGYPNYLRLCDIRCCTGYPEELNLIKVLTSSGYLVLRIGYLHISFGRVLCTLGVGFPKLNLECSL